MIEWMSAAAWLNVDSLVDAIRASAEHPWLQGWLTAVATFFFENVVCWTIVPPLISEGILGVPTALMSTFWGVFVGDLLMYLPVRFAMRFVTRLRWFRRHRARIALFENFFGAHLGKTMFVIRFTPGIRTPALLAAGMLRVDFGKYTLFSALSCFFQSLLVCTFMPTLYAPILAWLKRLWETHPSAVLALVTAFFLAFAVAQWFIAKAVMRHLAKKNAERHAGSPHQSA